MGTHSCIVQRSRIMVLAVVALLLQVAAAVKPKLPLPVRTIHEFSNPTYFQDILVKSDGDLILTTVWPNASIYSVKNPSSDNPTVSLILTPDDINAIPSIIEVEPDLYQCLGGQIYVPGAGVWGTFSVYELDLRSKHGRVNKKPSLEKLVNFPNSGLVGAIAPVPGQEGIVLAADSQLGEILRVNLRTGETEVIIKDKSMQPPAWAPLPAGMIQGIYHKGFLYYSLIFEALLYRIRLTDDGYLYPGAIGEEVAAVHTISVDKFTIGPEGYDDLWAATDADNRFVRVTPDGNVTFVAGAPDEKTMLGSVAAAFGKRPGEEKILYVATNGGFDNPLEGSVVEGGKLLAMDTSSFYEDDESDAHTGQLRKELPSSAKFVWGKQGSEKSQLWSSSDFVVDMMRFFVSYICGE